MAMPSNFDWDLDPGNPDLQSLLSLDLDTASVSGEQDLSPTLGLNFNSTLGADLGSDTGLVTTPALTTVSGVSNRQESNSTNQLLDPDDTGTVSDFYLNPQISENSLPNDDIWKKFDIFDGDESRDVNEERCESLDDLSALTWMNPMYSQTMTNDAREIRNHDCMWAGHCISEKHERNNQKNLKCTNLLPIKKPQSTRSEDPELIVLSTSEGPAFADGKFFGRKSGVVAPTHARSVLLPSRVVTPTATARNPASTKSHTITTSLRVNRSRTLDSGGESPRPETPQSLSDHEDLNLDLADMRSVEELVGSSFDYSFLSDMVPSIGNEVSNAFGSSDDFSVSQFDRWQQKSSSNVSSTVVPSKSAGNKVKKTVVKEEVPVSRHYTDNSFFSDHCYHLSKNTRMDNLGVQTPSDSELVAGTSGTVGSPLLALRPSEGTPPRKEEIDVETVYGDIRKPNSRSSSSGSVLPTNPSFSDRQQLQLTVASAINKKDVKKQSRTATVSTRIGVSDEGALGESSSATGSRRRNNAKNEVRRSVCNKRGAQSVDVTELINTALAKKRRCQQQRQQSQPQRRQQSQSQQRQQQVQMGNQETREEQQQQQAQNNTAPERTVSRRAGRGGNRHSAGSSDSEVDSIERRSIHNSMERQRRVDLRNSFELLRKLIPGTANNEKAAKVLILNSGADYCRQLAEEERELAKKKAELRRQQEMLMAKVSHLRRQLASKH